MLLVSDMQSESPVTIILDRLITFSLIYLVWLFDNLPTMISSFQIDLFTSFLVPMIHSANYGRDFRRILTLN